ncbi:peptidase A4 family-domain-containing protein [Mycena galopus ATCC 62051]|nr:peptidase A4 family-domain-containing protein [Mycena galopus ATCC 62051]
MPHSNLNNGHLSGPRAHTHISRDTVDPTFPGAFLTSGTYNSVSATSSLPTLKDPSNGSGNSDRYKMIVWVGVDASANPNCTSGGVLRVGIFMEVNSSNASPYNAWYQFGDASGSGNATSESMGAAGDITLKAALTNDKSGTITIENPTNQPPITFSHTFSSTSPVLCGGNAEWIVAEDTHGEELEFDFSQRGCGL